MTREPSPAASGVRQDSEPSLLQAGDDVSEAEWAHFDALTPYQLTDKALEVIERARAFDHTW